MKVVDNRVIAARAGIEFLDTDTGEVAAHHWTRGSCYFGVLPANGLLYVPPHDCACYVRAKLSGFLAMSSQPPTRAAAIPDDQRLQVPARVWETRPTLYRAEGRTSEDWPTYRHDRAVPDEQQTQVATDLLLGWQAPVGGKLTSPVIAENRVFLASTDEHTLHALDAATGAALAVPSTAGGFAAHHPRGIGSVRLPRWFGPCVASADGQLVWRFRASPEERLIVSRGQLESVWPVSGSVLVVDDTVYFAAGKSSYLDGGIRLYGLEPSHRPENRGRGRFDARSRRFPAVGRSGCGRLSERHLVQRRAADLPAASGFRSGGQRVGRAVRSSARRRRFSEFGHHRPSVVDLRAVVHLAAPGRVLRPASQPHVVPLRPDSWSRGTTIYGFGQNHYGRACRAGRAMGLFSADKHSGVPLDLSAVEYRKLALAGEHAVRFRWWKQLPIQVWAMVRTEDLLFVAGPVGNESVSPAAFEGLRTPCCWRFARRGKVLAEMPLPAAPVWDGMAAASGNLYLSLTDGQILCLWSAASGRPGIPLSPPAWRSLLPPVETAEEPG
jgi:hypothetical protein